MKKTALTILRGNRQRSVQQNKRREKAAEKAWPDGTATNSADENVFSTAPMQKEKHLGKKDPLNIYAGGGGNVPVPYSTEVAPRPKFAM